MARTVGARFKVALQSISDQRCGADGPVGSRPEHSLVLGPVAPLHAGNRPASEESERPIRIEAAERGVSGVESDHTRRPGAVPSSEDPSGTRPANRPP